MPPVNKFSSYRRYLIHKWASERGLILENEHLSLNPLDVYLSMGRQSIFKINVRDRNGLSFAGKITVGSFWNPFNLKQISVEWDNGLAPENGPTLPIQPYNGPLWNAYYYENPWLLWVIGIPIGYVLLRLKLINPHHHHTSIFFYILICFVFILLYKSNKR